MNLKLDKYVLKQYQTDKGFDAFPWALYCLYPHYSLLMTKEALLQRSRSTHTELYMYAHTVVSAIAEKT